MNRGARAILWSCAIGMVASGVLSGFAIGQTRSFHFDISTRPLSAALREYAKVSGQQIIFTEDVVAGKAPVSLHGDFTAEAALSQLLAGSDLVAEPSPSGTLMIHGPTVQGESGGSSAATTTSESVPNSKPAANAAGLDEIVVTGSRLALSGGYASPTPVTVVGPQQIQVAGKANLADLVNELPALVGSATPVNSNLSFSDGQAGINALNLRALGTDRTLVLIDSQRSVGSAITGIVDINDIPQSLVKRVEIVTGGASAAYGSDAVAGVVNFILDKEFTGFKVEASGGETAYSDDPTEKLTVTAGLPFAAGRGHFLINGEYNNVGGIYGVPRSWNNDGQYIMQNPAYQPGNGLPQRLVVSGAGLDEATLGGVITNTALRGVTFGPGGTPGQFNYGPVTHDPWTQGGEWQSNQFNSYNSLDQQVNRENLFSYTSYDLTDNTTLYGQVSRSETQARSEQLLQFNVGNLVIHAGNPFIPASVAQQMTALGISQFNLGTMNGDIPPIHFLGTRVVTRLVGGLKGKFEMFGRTWNWDTYVQDGITRSYETGIDVTQKAAFSNALNAVTDPTTGAPVCNVTLTNPASNCLPYNPMGLNVNSPATINYLFGGQQGGPHRFQRFTEDVASAILRGDAFTEWAGPVAVAAGVEHRREAVTGYADGNSLASNWFAGNYLPTFGSYNVTEGFAETNIPLLKNLPFAQALDFNGAIRRTDYSTSGQVSTWKFGSTWQPIDDLHFRVTRSHDIRAPNLNDLYAAGTANTNSVIDPFNNNANVTYQGKAVGNPNLQPEVSDTNTFGIVLTPRFVRGFQASVDYYDTKIRDAIGSVDPQTIVNNCFNGNQTYCAAITRGIGAGGTSVITQILLEPFNLVELRSRGIDFETSYQFNLSSIVSSWGGGLTVHALASHYLEDYTNDGIDPPTDYAGSTLLPSWIFNSSITYSNNPLTLAVTGRGFSATTISNQLIQCTSGCPLATASLPTINYNHAPGAFYLDLYGSYKFDMGTTGELEAFATVTNVANRDPGVVPNGPAGIAYAEVPTNESLYDVLGRVYRVGVRMRL